jgi:hypothetical protein
VYSALPQFEAIEPQPLRGGGLRERHLLALPATASNETSFVQPDVAETVEP